MSIITNTVTNLHELFYIAEHDLGEDEVEVLLEVAAALRDGRSVYGELRLNEDPRDFKREALEEDKDAIIYRVADYVRNRRSIGRKIQ